MYYSTIGHLLFIVIMLIAFGLTLTGLFTQHWRNTGDLDARYKQQFPEGLLPSSCYTFNRTGTANQDCFNFLQRQPVWNEIVLGGLFLAAAIQSIAILWSLIAFCACCCRENFIYALPGLATAASAFMVAALIVFGINNHKAKDDFRKCFNSHLPPTTTNTISYSYFIVIGALICTFISIAVGIFASIWPSKKDREIIEYQSPYPIKMFR